MRISILFLVVFLSACQSRFDRSENITGLEVYDYDKTAERIFIPLKRCSKLNSLGKVYSEKSGHKKKRHFCEAKLRTSDTSLRPKNWAYLFKEKGTKLKFCKYAITGLEFIGTEGGGELEMIVSKPIDCYEIQNP